MGNRRVIEDQTAHPSGLRSQWQTAVMPSITITLRELHSRVWSTPVDRLAREWSISNVGLGKLCRRLRVPVPPRGYWRRKETGRPVKEVALPRSVNPNQKVSVGYDERWAPPWAKASDATTNAPLHPLLAFEREPENQ